MESDDDIQPLIEYEESVPMHLDSVCQRLNSDEDFEQLVYGYRKCRWRTVLLNIVAVITFGIPYLLFHWCPWWKLYIAYVRSPFPLADCVLIIETYQKKCKSFYIEYVKEKNIADTSGLHNEAFQEDQIEEKRPIESSDDLFTPIHLSDGTTLNLKYYRYFRHKKQSLVWDSSRAQWCLIAGIECGATCNSLHAAAVQAGSSERRIRMLNIYGMNEIKVPVQSVLTLILLEVFNPFYVFQLFTICVWLAEPYYYYCVAVVLMSTFGVATSVIQTKKNQESLRATVEAYDSVALWDGRRVDSRCVAPGDVITLPPSRTTLHFDCVLLSGSAVLNESMLTGESVPVTKTPLLRTNKPFDLKEHASNILFCGTTVIQTKRYNNEPVKALVLRTGYNTSKGQLVRSILYPVPADFKFDRDSYKFIIILACIATIGLAYTVALKAYRQLTVRDIVIKALDIITIVIPPALPAAMTVGRLYCVSRLRRARVTCLNTRAVNVTGSIDCMCFDKTGTLTENGLDMLGVVAATGAWSPPALAAAPVRPHALPDLHQLKLAMATCHSLTRLQGELDGDPLDLKMFESTEWSLEEPETPRYSDSELIMSMIVRPKRHTNINVDDTHLPLEVGVVQQYQFVSSLQRASVVAKIIGEDVLRVYCKGAPEMLATLCKPETVPINLTEVLNSYAEKGYRVIAIATKMMEATRQDLDSMTRDEVECDLEFLGLVILENRLKGATTGIIRELKEANIHVAMVTGDNVHTAVSVARECGILSAGERVVTLHVDNSTDAPQLYCESTLQGSVVGKRTPLCSWGSDSGRGSWSRTSTSPGDIEIARPSDCSYKIVLTGDAWKVLREHYSSMVGRIASRGAVFARMTSEQKQQLILEYQALGYYVGMCGDGANDCGALRSAHTGISLSELESSVAAPFTSTQPDIVCVSRVLREGRAALTTSFGVFKFMVAYSLTEFYSVALLYYFDSNLTDFQFLFIDVALIVNFAFFFGGTEAYTGKLCKIPPLTSLLGLIPLLSLIGQMVLIGVAQFLSYYAVSLFPWYVRHTYEGEEENECWENYAIFTVSMFQYIILAIVFSHGAPYRKSIVTNKQLMASMIIMTAIAIYITVAPAHWLSHFLQLKMPLDSLMCYVVLALASFNFVIALFFERVIIQYVMERKQCIPKCLKERHVRKTPYLLLQRSFTEMDYLDCDSLVRFEKETNTVSDESSSRS